MILLDTTVPIELFRKKNKQKTFFYELTKSHTEFAISTITHYQVLIGSNKNQDQFWDKFFNSLTILPFDIACSYEAVKIYKNLIAKNKLIELADLTIGATAKANNLQFATLNEKHFKRIEGLKIIKRIERNE